MADRDLRQQTGLAEPGAWLMFVSSALGLIASLIYYFWRGDGIAYTPGVLLVIISTALLVVASLLLATRVLPNQFLVGFFVVAGALDIVGTAFAAWMLEAHWLIAAMALAGAGCIIHVGFDAGTRAAENARLQESR